MDTVSCLIFLTTLWICIVQTRSAIPLVPVDDQNIEDRIKREGKIPECCGLSGRDGRDGRDGIQGPYGPPGPPGEKGPAGTSCIANYDKSLDNVLESVTAKISTLLDSHVTKKILEILDQHLRNTPLTKKSEEKSGRSVSGGVFPEQSSQPHGNTGQAPIGGSVYTRWGRKICPDHSDILYPGLMAGAHYQHEGSGANHLCLPLTPQWNKTFAGRQSNSLLYGTELELHNTNPIFKTTNSGGAFAHNRDVQCAVCYTPGRPSHVMIPARLECPTGWTVEYLGFLMAAHHTHKKTEWVCVDQDPDTHAGTAADVNGNLLYKVEAACGPLPCPEYVDGYEVTCVVCTK